MLDHGDDKAAGFVLDRRGLASTEASRVALLSGDADMIAGDWIWVSRQRAAGDDFTFLPFSTAVGALVVPAASDIAGIADLVGKRVGIAGGPLDKSWLLLQAVAQRRHGLGIRKVVEASFGAPPLLGEQLRYGRIDAVLTFWHFAARLEAEGYRRVLDVRELIVTLGGSADLPMIGFVFRADWARANPATLAGFVAALRAAQQRLAHDDAEWERLRPLIKPSSDAELVRLRDVFRAGIPPAEGDWPTAAAAIFSVLSEQGGPKLVGDAPMLQPGTFWRTAP
jgi:NitT/TauT family transport system substrate-binding protein